MKKKGLKKRNSSKSSQIGDGGEKRRKLSEIKSLKILQEEVCDVCGHIGFANALMYCSACSHTAVHQYCLGIPPGSIDDTYYWLCEYCSVSDESQHHNSSFEESLSELASALELETEQYKDTTIIVEDEIEPLCILPPLVHQGCPEHQCGIAEIMLNTSSTFTSHPSCSQKRYGSASSSHRNMRMHDGSYSQVAEGILVNGSISLDHLLNDREESEAFVSSLMECPKEIMSGLVLLVSLSGRIVIQRGMGFCASSAPLIDNMTNNCNELNSEKLVMEPVTCHGNVKDGDHLKCTKRKRKRTTQVKFDLLQPLGSECKRVRSKRYKISSSLNKEIYTQAANIPSIGKEGNVQPTNGLEAHHETVQANTLVYVDPLKIDGFQFKAFTKNCDMYSEMIETCGSNVVNSTTEVHNRLCDQETNNLDLDLVAKTLPVKNVSSNQDLAITFAQENGKVVSLNEGIGINKALTYTSLASTPRCMQLNPSLNICMKDLSPLELCGVEVLKGLEQKREIKKGLVDKNVPHLKEVSNLVDLGTSLLKLPPLYDNDPTSAVVELGSSTQISYDEQTTMERAQDAIVEDFDNAKKFKERYAWKEYDLEFERLKTNLDAEKKKLEEVFKKNRRNLWKVVYELENTKKELNEKAFELAKKTAELKMAKELVLAKNEDFVVSKKEAYDLWLAGYTSAQSVIYQLHPELNWGGIKAVGNLLFLRYK